MTDTEDYWFHLYKPCQGDTIVDVGAGVGEDLKAFSQAVGPEGRVIAIEAHPVASWQLHTIRRQEGLDNTAILNYAVMREAGPVFIEDRDYLLNRAVETVEGHDKVLPAWGETLDLVHRQLKLGVVDMMKMNIEGGENMALQGAREFLKRCRYVCVACHDFRSWEGETFKTQGFVTGFLEDLGFEWYIRADDPRGYVRDHVHGRNTQIT